MPEIAIWEQHGSAVRERLDQLRDVAPGYDIRFFDSPQSLESQVESAEIVATTGLSEDALSRARSMNLLHYWGAGVDHVLYPALVEHPVTMTCSKGNGGVTMAEWAVAMMLSWTKHLPHYFDSAARRQWAPRQHGELSRSTVGIIGLGNSGADLARKCKAFHMRVLGFRRDTRPCENVDQIFTADNFHRLLAESDFVVVTAPLTRETRGMLGVNELRAMKSTAYLIVTSRGGIATDDALLSALREGWIAGAALDAHTVEPLAQTSPFWSLPNTFISPHCAASGDQVPKRSAEIFIEIVRRYMLGEPLINVVDKTVGY